MKHPAIARVLLADITALRIAIAIGGITFGLGLVFGNGDNAAYEKMYHLAPNWSWAAAFFCYAVGTCLGAAHWPNGIPRAFTIFVIALGLFLWSYVFFSFAADGLSPAEYMMLSVIFCEVWVGANELAGNNK